MKTCIKIVVFLLVVVIVVGLIAVVKLDSLIKTSVETIGPQVTGVAVTLEKVSLSLLKGELKLKGLVVGNPEGFSTPSAMSLGSFEARLNVKSLLSDKIIVEQVLIKAPEITYEGSLKGSNLSKLMEQIGGDEEPPAEEKKPEEKPQPKEQAEGGKKVIINDLLIEDARVNLSISGLGGHAAPLPLPAIHLQDIGKEKDGASIPEVIGMVFGAVFKAVTTVVTGSVNLVGKGAVAATGAAVEGVGKGVDVVGSAAGKGVDAVSDGASKLVGGVKGLLGGEEKEPKKE